MPGVDIKSVDDACITDLVLSGSSGDALAADVVDCLSIVYEEVACDDVDNDGDSDDSDAYLKKRRKAVTKAVKGDG